MAQVSVTWQHEDLLLQAENDTGNTIVLDSGAGVGGKNRGARPLQLLLMGLAGCTAMDVLSILQKKREPVQDFQVTVSGQQVESHPRVFAALHIEYIITGDVSEKAVQRAIDLSENIYCPAQAMLRPGAVITSSYRIVQP
ncbi:MAG TPA: OsmC family protein [Anaerolineae bacterium]|nr:OsmC family protein [Anaerolineae bacterium]HNU05618.1 OsmC family protein [Anaerolineae bacterium]